VSGVLRADGVEDDIEGAQVGRAGGGVAEGLVGAQLADETEVARASAAERRRPYGAAEVAYDPGRTARRAS
jgi:hypothetical protein